MNGVPWTSKEISQLAADYEAGVSYVELLKRLPDRTAAALGKKISIMGLMRPTGFLVANPNIRLDLDFSHMRDLWENYPELTAATIGERFGISKNAVIGHSKRKDWAPRVEKPKPPERADFPPAGHCQFPIGHPGAPGFHFCGGPCGRISPPYCDSHHELCRGRQ